MGIYLFYSMEEAYDYKEAPKNARSYDSFEEAIEIGLHTISDYYSKGINQTKDTFVNDIEDFLEEDHPYYMFDEKNRWKCIYVYYYAENGLYDGEIVYLNYDNLEDILKKYHIIQEETEEINDDYIDEIFDSFELEDESEETNDDTLDWHATIEDEIDELDMYYQEKEEDFTGLDYLF